MGFEKIFLLYNRLYNSRIFFLYLGAYERWPITLYNFWRWAPVLISAVSFLILVLANHGDVSNRKSDRRKPASGGQTLRKGERPRKAKSPGEWNLYFLFLCLVMGLLKFPMWHMVFGIPPSVIPSGWCWGHTGVILAQPLGFPGRLVVIETPTFLQAAPNTNCIYMLVETAHQACFSPILGGMLSRKRFIL